MAARLSASPLISYAALIPLLSRRAATVRYPFPFAGRSLLSFSSKTLTVARDATAMDVSAQARRGFASQVDDFASRKYVEGILFFDRMTEDVLESIRSELKALEQKYESRTGLPSPENIDKYERTRRRNEIAGFAGR
ncbi:hypothetical protein BHE74_00033874 [Ensete ventricosum]|nr:hypothetical protein BHE74_00033874 [Ensete ventricosum]